MLAKTILILLCAEAAFACFGMGGCGGGCGQQCGRFCARAKGSKTLTFETETKNPKTPDEEFLSCCQDRDLPAPCLSKCSYRAYSSTSLRTMFFGLDACPIEAASALHFCASRGKDHRACCARAGVGATEAGNRCFLFCDEEPNNRTQLDFSFLPCLEKFDSMKQCFWNDIVTEYPAYAPAPVRAQPQLQQPQLQQYQAFYRPAEPVRPNAYGIYSPRTSGLQPLAVSPL